MDLVSTTLGLLINLAEQDKACQPILAGLSLPHGKVVVPLLCRLMQVRQCSKVSLTCLIKLKPVSQCGKPEPATWSINLVPSALLCN